MGRFLSSKVEQQYLANRSRSEEIVIANREGGDGARHLTRHEQRALVISLRHVVDTLR